MITKSSARQRICISSEFVGTGKALPEDLHFFVRHVIIYIVIPLERQNNLKDLKSSRNSIIQRIVIMNMHSEPVLQGMPEIFNWIQFG